MKQKRFSIAVAALCTVLAACGSADGAGPAAGGPDSAGLAGGPAHTGAAGNGSASAPSGGPANTCVPGIPATSQIPRLLNRQYEAAVRDLLGVTAVGSDNKPASQLLVADSDGPMTPDAWRIYRDVAGQIAHAVLASPNRSKFIGCDPAANGCMDQTVRSFGRKAFRRPLTQAEVARFAKLAQTTPPGTPEEVAETTLQAFLVSPSFLLLPELTATTEPKSTGIALSSHELATRLSFLLWGSVPDDALNAAADADQLKTKEQILAQAQRMIAVRRRPGR